MPNKATSANDLVQPVLRIPERLRRQLKAEAVKNNRSLVAEMRHRLAKSIEADKKPSHRKLESVDW